MCEVDVFSRSHFVTHLQHRLHKAALARWNERELVAERRHISNTLNARLAAVMNDEPMPVESDALFVCVYLLTL